MAETIIVKNRQQFFSVYSKVKDCIFWRESGPTTIEIKVAFGEKYIMPILNTIK
jgi:hypothetical protein